MRPFRQYHLFELLAGYGKQRLPLASWVNHYFRSHKSLGSKDRRWIGEAAYSLVRWKGLWDHLGASDWEGRLRLSEESPPEAYRHREEIPPHIRCSFPYPLYQQLVADHGEGGAFELAIASNHPAPLTIRVNRLRGSREELAERLPFSTRPCKLSDVGLVVEGRPQLLALPEYREGWFELQDEASQGIAKLVGAQPGEEGLDYCAGAGGKALALAAEMGNKGQITLHDVRQKMLYKARKRIERAGVKNTRYLEGDLLHRLKGRMDFVLVDAPCSGTGTLRRQPDAKYRIGSKSWTDKQRAIVGRAAQTLAPTGRLIYATCSLLHEENGGQLAYFRQELGLKVVGQPFQSLPKDGEMDGFYGVVLTRCQS